jgi:hypothetical protein
VISITGGVILTTTNDSLMNDPAVLAIFDEAREELVKDEDVVCRHCLECRRDHIGPKCLYSPTAFDAALCVGCRLPHMRGLGEDAFFINPINKRGYHLDCDPDFMRIRKEILAAVGLPKEIICP